MYQYVELSGKDGAEYLLHIESKKRKEITPSTKMLCHAKILFEYLCFFIMKYSEQDFDKNIVLDK